VLLLALQSQTTLKSVKNDIYCLDFIIKYKSQLPNSVKVTKLQSYCNLLDGSFVHSTTENSMDWKIDSWDL